MSGDKRRDDDAPARERAGHYEACENIKAHLLNSPGADYRVSQAGEAPHERVMSGCAAPTLASSSQQPAMPGHAEGALSKQPTAPRTRKPTPTLSGLPVELKQLILDELVSSVRKYESEARDDDDPDGDRYEVMFPNSGFNKVRVLV